MYDIRFVAAAFSVVAKPEVLKLHIKSLQHHLIINSSVNHTSGRKHYILLLKQKSYEGQVNGNNCRVSRPLFFFLREMFEQITSVAVTAADERAAATTQPSFTLLSPSFPSCSYQTLFFSSSQVCRVSNSQIIHLGTYTVSTGRGWEWWGWRQHLRISFFLPVRQIYIYTVDTATWWHGTKRSISLDLYQ